MTVQAVHTGWQALAMDDSPSRAQPSGDNSRWKQVIGDCLVATSTSLCDPQVAAAPSLCHHLGRRQQASS